MERSPLTTIKARILLTVLKSLSQIQKMNFIFLFAITGLCALAVIADDAAVKDSVLIALPIGVALQIISQGGVFRALTEYLDSALATLEQRAS